MSGYEIRIMDHEEFDALPYKKAKQSVGLADPKTNVAYIRHTGVKGLDENTISHEFDELIMKVSPHEEDGIRYKGWWIPIIKALAKFVASKALPALIAKGAIIGGTVGGLKSKLSGGDFWGRGMGQGALWGGAGGALGGMAGGLGSGTSQVANVAGQSGQISGSLGSQIGAQSIGDILGTVGDKFAGSIGSTGGSLGGGAVNVGTSLGSGLAGMGSQIASGVGGASLAPSSAASLGSYQPGLSSYGLGGTSQSFSTGAGSTSKALDVFNDLKPAFTDTAKRVGTDLGKDTLGKALAPQGHTPLSIGQEGSAFRAFAPNTTYNPNSFDPSSISDEYAYGRSNIAKNSLNRIGSTLDAFRGAGVGDVSGNSALQKQLANIRESQAASEESLKHDLTNRGQLHDRYKQLASANGWDDTTMQKHIQLSGQPLSEISKTFSNAQAFKDAFGPLWQLFKKNTEIRTPVSLTGPLQSPSGTDYYGFKTTIPF